MTAADYAVTAACFLAGAAVAGAILLRALDRGVSLPAPGSRWAR